MSRIILKSTCPRDCYDGCGMRIVVEDGVISSVLGDPEHPLTKGKLCGKCALAYNGAWRDPTARPGGVLTSLVALPGGGLRVETTQGFGIVPFGFSIRPSPDDRAHACLRQIGPDVEHLGWMVVCLFLPGHV